jgi:hypothetical protein
MSVEMEKKHGDIRTDKFINKQDQTVNISFDEYRKLKRDASKWSMITWAIDNEIEFISGDCHDYYIDMANINRLETLYLEWLEEQRGVK